jgi:hypothetical protein
MLDGLALETAQVFLFLADEKFFLGVDAVFGSVVFRVEA